MLKMGIIRFFYENTKKRGFCFANFSMNMALTEKNAIFHDKANDKCNKTVNSEFRFSQLCHR